MEEPDGFEAMQYLPLKRLSYNEPGLTYTIVELKSSDSGMFAQDICYQSIISQVYSF